MARRPLSPPMTCPACAGHGHGDPPAGMSKRYPTCRKCAGKGTIAPAEPQRPAPASAFAALIP